ncbi:MAG: hypothetical protein IE933_03390 [Sphingomonadales bacterium]|nr:hypothetical protein [Sphingomonadales bacterium]MBD3772084.1 hypothetical protein [Paracoccaceae bacterium]
MNGHPPFFSNAEVVEIDPVEIYVPERIGFLHEDKAVALGRLIAVDGQRDPIKIARRSGNPKQPWQLVTGRHRLRGAELEGISIFAIEVNGNAEDFADLEASENLHRRPLSPIERAKFTAALVRAAQERIAREHGTLSHQRLGAKARWDRVKHGETSAEEALRDETEDAYAKMAQAYGWEESVGEALGMSRRTIHRDLSLYRLLVEPFPELAEPLSKHPVVGENASQLKAIAQVKDEGQRRAVIEALLGDDELSAELARARVGIDRPGGAAPTAEQKVLSAVIGNLGRLTATQQKHHVDSLVRALKSDEVKRQLRDRLNEELGE